jgi:hypothetical protein
MEMTTGDDFSQRHERCRIIEHQRAHQLVAALSSPELRNSLGKMRLNNLAVGVDGRNRVMLSPFRSKWWRLWRQDQTHAPVSFLGVDVGDRISGRRLDQSAQPGGRPEDEFGITGLVSAGRRPPADANMLEAYQTGDPYLAFAKSAGAVPEHATKESHSTIRDQYKQCALGVSLASSIPLLGYL